MDAVAIAALVVAIAGTFIAIYLKPFIERPRLEITESKWSQEEQFPWTFAVFQVHNKPLSAFFGSFLTRQIAQGCVVEIDYFKWETDERVFPMTITGRWSSHNPPVTWIQEPQELTGRVVTTAVTGVPRQPMGPGYVGLYDPTPSLDPDQNIAVSERGEEVAVAILQKISGFEAYAWSKESYMYEDWKNPDLRLDYQDIYRIDV